MAEYEATRGMPAGSDVVFGVASDVELINRWLPHGLWVRDSGPNTLEAGGDVVPGDGRHEGLYDVSAEQLRVEWGGRDHPGYAGWLQVSDSKSGTSEVTVHISLLDEPLEKTSRSRADEVQGMLEDSLRRLSDEVGARLSG
jgi:hypothetical protein